MEFAEAAGVLKVSFYLPSAASVRHFARLLSASTTNQSGNMPHACSLLAIFEIFARRVHYFKEVWSAAI